MPPTIVKLSPDVKMAAGQPMQANDPGDIWSVEIRGAYDDNVATSSRWLYRQVASFADDDNVPEILLNRFIVDLSAPIRGLLAYLDPSFAFKCAVIRNISTPKAFSSSFNVVDGEGVYPTPGYDSPSITLNLRYADVTGARSARKVVYLPGFSSDLFINSKLQDAALTNFLLAIEKFYTLNDGAEDQFQWSYGLVDGVYQDAANAHPAIFIGRLKSRQSTLC